MEAASAHKASKAALKPLKLRQSFPAHDASSPRMACTRPQTSKTVCRFLQSRDNGFRKVAKRCLAALSEVQSPSIPNSSAPCPMALAHHLLRSGECQTFWQKESDPWIHSCMRLFKVGLLENGRFSSLVVACAQSRPTILMFGIAMSNVWVWSAARRTPRCKSLAKSSADAASVTMIETRCFNRCNKSSSTTPSALAEPRGGHFQGWQKCCMIWAVAVAMLSAEPSSACRPKEPETMVKSGNTALNRRRRLPLRSSRIRAKQCASESNFLLWAQIASDRAYLIRLFFYHLPNHPVGWILLASSISWHLQNLPWEVLFLQTHCFWRRLCMPSHAIVIFHVFQGCSFSKCLLALVRKLPTVLASHLLHKLRIRVWFPHWLILPWATGFCVFSMRCVKHTARILSETPCKLSDAALATCLAPALQQLKPSPCRRAEK